LKRSDEGKAEKRGRRALFAGDSSGNWGEHRRDWVGKEAAIRRSECTRGGKKGRKFPWPASEDDVGEKGEKGDRGALF